MGEPMKGFKTIYIRNGDVLEPYRIYRCERCDDIVEESFPYCEDDNGVYCWDCSFLLGMIDEKEYLFNHRGWRVEIRDGVIYQTPPHTRFPWEKTIQDERKKPAYKEWRIAVFERDNYTCAHCGKVGGNLNAHHIKPYAEYPELRLDINNGITLCEECHRKVHGKGRNGGKK